MQNKTTTAVTKKKDKKMNSRKVWEYFERCDPGYGEFIRLFLNNHGYPPSTSLESLINLKLHLLGMRYLFAKWLALFLFSLLSGIALGYCSSYGFWGLNQSVTATLIVAIGIPSAVLLIVSFVNVLTYFPNASPSERAQRKYIELFEKVALEFIKTFLENSPKTLSLLERCKRSLEDIARLISAPTICSGNDTVAKLQRERLNRAIDFMVDEELILSTDVPKLYGTLFPSEESLEPSPQG